jgi:acetyl esterase/lipase
MEQGVSVEGLGVETEADWDHLRTPESYLDYARGEHFASPGAVVRYDGTIHDFMLLNALSQTRATRAAIDQATAFLRAGLGTA